MEPAAYPPPLDRLLTLEPTPAFGDDWADYRPLGIGPEHVPDLIRMVRDPRLLHDDSDTPAWAAPVHAWRALAQMGDAAAPAVGPLLETLAEISEADDSDWGAEDMPAAFGRIGPAAIGPIETFLADGSRDVYARAAAARGLVQVAQRFPEARDRCVAALTAALARHRDQPPDLNGFLTGYLLELKAAEAAPLFREAFKLETITESIAGGWRDVREELKLEPTPGDPPDRPRKPDPHLARLRESFGLDFPSAPPPLPAARRNSVPALHSVSPDVQAQRKHQKERERAQARRKQERKARRQNRKR